MGGVLGKRRARAHPYKKSNDLKQRIRLLEDERLELRCKQEMENSMHEHESRLFTGKEAKWKRERKKWREEVKKLKNRLEKKDEVIEMLEGRRGDQVYTVKDDKVQWQLLGATVLVEQMREEQALRDEAVEKWKGLYLAIKAELDDLILRTHDGDTQRLWLTSSEVEVMEGLQRELLSKEEIVEGLRASVVGLEKEVTNRERQMDIMRQSLRILSNGNPGQTPRRSHSRSLYWSKSRARKLLNNESSSYVECKCKTAN